MSEEMIFIPGNETENGFFLDAPIDAFFAQINEKGSQLGKQILEDSEETRQTLFDMGILIDTDTYKIEIDDDVTECVRVMPSLDDSRQIGNSPLRIPAMIILLIAMRENKMGADFKTLPKWLKKSPLISFFEDEDADQISKISEYAEELSEKEERLNCKDRSFLLLDSQVIFLALKQFLELAKEKNGIDEAFEYLESKIRKVKSFDIDIDV